MDLNDELALSALNPDILPDPQAGTENDSSEPTRRAPFIDDEPLDLEWAERQKIMGVYMIKVQREVVERWKEEMEGGPVEGEGGLQPRVLGTLRVWEKDADHPEETFDLLLPSSSSSPPPPTDPNSNSPSSHPTTSHTLLDLPSSSFTSSQAEINPQTGATLDKKGQLAMRRVLWAENGEGRGRKWEFGGRTRTYDCTFLPFFKSIPPSSASTIPAGKPHIIGPAQKVSTLINSTHPYASSSTIASGSGSGGVSYKKEILGRYEAAERAKPKMRRLDKEGLTQRELNQMMMGQHYPRQDYKGKSTGNTPIRSTFSTAKTSASTISSSAKNKFVRLDKASLLDLLFESFAEYQYWSLKGLRERVMQPEMWLRDCLGGIAVQERGGAYNNLWRLNDYYLKQQGDAELMSSAPENLGTAESAIQAQGRAMQAQDLEGEQGQGGGAGGAYDVDEDDEDDEDDDEDMEAVD